MVRNKRKETFNLSKSNIKEIQCIHVIARTSTMNYLFNLITLMNVTKKKTFAKRASFRIARKATSGPIEPPPTWSKAYLCNGQVVKILKPGHKRRKKRGLVNPAKSRPPYKLKHCDDEMEPMSMLVLCASIRHVYSTQNSVRGCVGVSVGGGRGKSLCRSRNCGRRREGIERQ